MPGDDMAESHTTNGEKDVGPGTGMGKMTESEKYDHLNGKITSMAQAMQTLVDEVSTLTNEKRKAGESTSTSAQNSGKKQKRSDTDVSAQDTDVSAQERRPRSVSPQPGTNAMHSDTENDDDIDLFMTEENTENDEEEEEDSALAELEGFFCDNQETGPDVDKRTARITNEALRGQKRKEDDEKMKELAKEQKRPGNVGNLQVPKVDDILWRQLRRETKTIDFIQQKATSTYNLALTPLVRALDKLKKKEYAEAVPHMTASFKILGLAVKQTTHARRERIKREINPQFKSICEQEATATHLFGENLPEQVKKLHSIKQLTTQRNGSFLARRGGRNYNFHNNHSYHRFPQNRYQNKGNPQRFGQKNQPTYKKGQNKNNRK